MEIKDWLRKPIYTLWKRIPEATRNIIRRSTTAKVVARWLIDFDQYLSLDAKDFTKNLLNGISEVNVDVVVTSYRQSQFLVQCLNSILNQRISISSITLVNHCPDPSEISKFNAASQGYLEDKRVRVMHLDESWPGYARNIGARMGNSDLLVFIDIDDWISSVYLENAILTLYATSSDFVGADCEIFNESGTLGAWFLKRVPSVKDLISTNAFPVSSVIKRKTFMLLEGWRDYDARGKRQDEAIDLWRRGYFTGKVGGNVRQQLIHLRRHSSNLSDVENSLITSKALTKSFKMLKKDLKPHFKKQKRQFSVPSFIGVVLKISPWELHKNRKTIVFLAADGTLFGAGKVTKSLIDQCLQENLNVIVLNCDYLSQGAPLAELVDVLWIEFGAIIPRSLWLQTLQLWLSEMQPDWIISTGHPDVDLLLEALKNRMVSSKFATTMFNTKSLHSSLIIDNSQIYDKVLVESKFSLNWLTQNNVAVSKIEIIRHLAHRINLQSKLHVPFNTQINGIRIGWFHRFSFEKQPSHFMEIASDKSLLDYEFVMGGTGPLREKFEKAASDTRIQFMLQNSTTEDFLNSIDISVITSSKVEGRPLAVLEALEAGKVVMANDVGALSELKELGYLGLFLFNSINEMISFLHSQSGMLRKLVREKAVNEIVNQNISEKYFQNGKSLLEILELN